MDYDVLASILNILLIINERIVFVECDAKNQPYCKPNELRISKVNYIHRDLHNVMDKLLKILSLFSRIKDKNYVGIK